MGGVYSLRDLLAGGSTETVDPFRTSIPYNRESEFQDWTRANRITDLDHPDSHYDYRGAFLEGVKPEVAPDGVAHWPDTYKTPGHPTFSVESKYAAGRNDAGIWQGDQFVPASQLLESERRSGNYDGPLSPEPPAPSAQAPPSSGGGEYSLRDLLASAGPPAVEATVTGRSPTLAVPSDALATNLPRPHQPEIRAVPEPGALERGAKAALTTAAEQFNLGQAPIASPAHERARTAARLESGSLKGGPEDLETDLATGIGEFVGGMAPLLIPGAEVAAPTVAMPFMAGEKMAMAALERAAKAGIPFAQRVVDMAASPEGATLVQRAVSRAVRGAATGGTGALAATTTETLGKEGRLPTASEAAESFAGGTVLTPAIGAAGEVLGTAARKLLGSMFDIPVDAPPSRVVETAKAAAEHLGVDLDKTPQSEIDALIRKAAKQYHADVNRDPAAAQTMQDILAARSAINRYRNGEPGYVEPTVPTGAAEATESAPGRSAEPPPVSSRQQAGVTSPAEAAPTPATEPYKLSELLNEAGTGRPSDVTAPEAVTPPERTAPPERGPVSAAAPIHENTLSTLAMARELAEAGASLKGPELEAAKARIIEKYAPEKPAAVPTPPAAAVAPPPEAPSAPESGQVAPITGTEVPPKVPSLAEVKPGDTVRFTESKPGAPFGTEHVNEGIVVRTVTNPVTKEPAAVVRTGTGREVGVTAATFHGLTTAAPQGGKPAEAAAKVRTIPPGSSLAEVEASRAFNAKLRGDYMGRRALEEGLQGSVESGESALPSEVVAALKKVDDLGFDSPEQAVAAILQHADWRSRWDVTEADAASASVLSDWKAKTLGYAPPETPALRPEVGTKVLPPTAAVEPPRLGPAPTEPEKPKVEVGRSATPSNPTPVVRFRAHNGRTTFIVHKNVGVGVPGTPGHPEHVKPWRFTEVLEEEGKPGSIHSMQGHNEYDTYEEAVAGAKEAVRLRAKEARKKVPSLEPEVEPPTLGVAPTEPQRPTVTAKAGVPLRITTKGGEVIDVPDARPIPKNAIPGFDDLNLLAHKTPRMGGDATWSVTEPTTGLNVARGRTRADAIAKAATELNTVGRAKVDQAIRDEVAKKVAQVPVGSPEVTARPESPAMGPAPTTPPAPIAETPKEAPAEKSEAQQRVERAQEQVATEKARAEAGGVTTGEPIDATKATADAVAAAGRHAQAQERLKQAEADVKVEEETKAAEVGAGLESGGVRLDLAAKAVTGFMRRFFTSKGNLPQAAFDQNLRRMADLTAREGETTFTVRDFRAAAKKAYGRNSLTEAERRLLDDVLKGDRPATDAPPLLRPVLETMRRQIDALSQEMIDVGAVEGDVVGTVTDNLGTYATRAYRVFDDPSWAARVPEPVKNKAKALLRSEYPKATPEEIDGLLDALLYRSEDGPMQLLARGGTLGTKDLSILQKRKNVAPEIRALWGEYHDPLVSYTRSVTKMGHLIANHQFLSDVRDEGLGEFLFEKPIVKDGQSYHTKFAAEGSKVLEPLNGLYTTPEIAQAFRDAFMPRNPSAWLRGYMAVNTAVKAAKTVLSPVTHIRNTTGNIGFAVANGHWRVGEGLEAVRGVLSELGLGDTTARRDYLTRLRRLGVIGESARAGELEAAVGDVIRPASDLSQLLMARAVRAAGKGAAALYRTEDDLWKMYAFANERARYAQALPNLTDAELDQRAAKIVRNTFPTYSLVPRGIQNLRRFPLVGSFPSFAAEVYRTGYHTLGLAVEELADPARRRIGAERLAGILLAVTGITAISIASRQLTGWTKDKVEALRHFLPPWSENSPLLMVGGDSTEARAVDLGYSDVYSYFRKPILALMRGENWHSALADAAVETARPFLGEEILAGVLADVARNKTSIGGRVYNPEDDPESQAEDIAGHLWKAFEPGAVTSAARIWKGLRGTTDDTGRSYDAESELAAVATGQRIMHIDFAQAMRFQARRRLGELRDTELRITGLLARRGTGKTADIEPEYRAMDTHRFNVMRELHEDVRAASLLGVSDATLLQSLDAGGLSKQMAGDVMKGVYRPYEPSDTFLKGVRDRLLQEGTPEQRSAAEAELGQRTSELGKAVNATSARSLENSTPVALPPGRPSRPKAPPRPQRPR